MIYENERLSLPFMVRLAIALNLAVPFFILALGIFY
jgi:hypothetical protein